MVKLSRPRASRRWDWTSYGCDRQKKGRPGDLRDTMIAGIALAHHAALIGCETCRVGVRPCGPRVLRSVLHRPDCSQAKQIVVRRDERKVHERPLAKVAALS